MSSCASSGTYVETEINIPDQPANIRNAGGIVAIPPNSLKKIQTNKLMLQLRESELRNARAVNSCKSYHTYLQTIYKATPQKQYMKNKF